MEDADSLLLGRITHGDFAGHWPQVADDPTEPDEVRAYARRVAAMDRIVISASGNTAPWKNTRRLERIDPDEITELKRGTGGDGRSRHRAGHPRMLTEARSPQPFRGWSVTVRLGRRLAQ